MCSACFNRLSRAATYPGRCWSRTCPKTSITTWTSSSASLDWDKNVDTHFKQSNYLEPIRDDDRSGDGYEDLWIVYGTVDGRQLFSAKELTLQPVRNVILQDPGASSWITVQGRGRLGGLDLQTPAMIRFGENTTGRSFYLVRRGSRRC